MACGAPAAWTNQLLGPLAWGGYFCQVSRWWVEMLNMLVYCLVIIQISLSLFRLRNLSGLCHQIHHSWEITHPVGGHRWHWGNFLVLCLFGACFTEAVQDHLLHPVTSLLSVSLLDVHESWLPVTLTGCDCFANDGHKCHCHPEYPGKIWVEMDFLLVFSLSFEVVSMNKEQHIF